ncbi:MAG: hypoxanthine phosphoribosyltransferase, partial [Blastocatellia bacterium]|nr:hypoxanthine phosphoribosyltransferase [Blastocatellia bacterium]
MEEDVASILISADELQAKVRELGQAISRDYAGLDPLLVGVLKGVVVFMADLLRAITIPVSVDFLAISSYGPQAASLGIVRIIKDLDQDIHGRHV